MSHGAIAAALALVEVSGGERLAAFSLASFANLEHRAWPGTRIASARAGLSRSQYLASRDGLSRRDLVVVESPGGGRGNAPVVLVSFAHAGRRVEAEINAPLFEGVLSYSHVRGSARLLLATLAALAGEDMCVVGMTTEELRMAAGMADSTYRRARAALLTSGAVTIESGGGRARTNSWQLRDPRGGDAMPVAVLWPRAVPPREARSLMAAVPHRPSAEGSGDAGPATERVNDSSLGDGIAQRNLSRNWTATAAECPASSGEMVNNPVQVRTVWAVKGPTSSADPEQNPAQDRAVSPQTPAQTPSETPALYVRAGRESQNLKTAPPDPPEGGHGSLTITEPFISPTGRRRVRTVRVDPAAARGELQAPIDEDHREWQRKRAALRERLGADQFEVWLAGFALVAITGRERTLLLNGPAMTRTWVSQRFAAAFTDAAASTGRPVRVASARELALLSALDDADTAASPVSAGSDSAVHIDDKEAV
jgi:hypothetical protein